MSDEATGNVAVGGSVDPDDASFQVAGNAKIDSTLFVSVVAGASPLEFKTGVTPTTRMTIGDDGRVAIGAAAPVPGGEALQVDGVAKSTEVKTEALVTSLSELPVRVGELRALSTTFRADGLAANNIETNAIDTASSIEFKTNGVTRATLAPTGEWAIGAAPVPGGEALQVAGVVSSTEVKTNAVVTSLSELPIRVGELRALAATFSATGLATNSIETNAIDTTSSLEFKTGGVTRATLAPTGELAIGAAPVPGAEALQVAGVVKSTEVKTNAIVTSASELPIRVGELRAIVATFNMSGLETPNLKTSTVSSDTDIVFQTSGATRLRVSDSISEFTAADGSKIMMDPINKTIELVNGPGRALEPLAIIVNGSQVMSLSPPLTGGGQTSPNVLLGSSANTIAAGVVGATISGGGSLAQPHTRSTNFATVGGGLDNTAGGTGATISGGWGNETTESFGTIGGGRSNVVNAPYGTIAGGGEGSPGNPATANRVLDYYGTVGGGANNQAGSDDGFPSSAIFPTVGGGHSNTAEKQSATVGGGEDNTASGRGSTVAGGEDNIASNNYASVPGGQFNEAVGSFSVAAGRRAKANHNGAFVWADATDADFASTSTNQFNVRAGGGTRIFSNTTATVGVSLAAGGNSWSVISDRALKENFTQLDPVEVLQKLAQVPVSKWNLKSQDTSIRHIGPMAQDFYAAFGVGESDRYISSSDADGVALAAIQGLHEILKEKDAEIGTLQGEVCILQERVNALEDRVLKMSLSARVSTLGMTTPALAMVGLIGLVVIGRSRKGGA